MVNKVTQKTVRNKTAKKTETAKNTERNKTAKKQNCEE